MSHFTVLVVGDDVEEHLAPYDENGGSPHREYLDTSSLRAMAKEYGVSRPNDLAALLPHIEDWTGFEGGIDKKGLYCVSDRNADAKWDWYVVGGRWRGFFKLKDGASGELGPDFDRILGGEAPKDVTGRADVARKGDIDFAGMRRDAESRARATWHAYAAAIDGTPEPLPWAEFERKVDAETMTADAARKAYHAQERVRAFRRAMEPHLGPFISLEAFPATEEDYVAEKRRAAMLPFAYLLHGEWHERGEMGWWGIAQNEQRGDEWAEDVEAMLASLPDGTLLTIVDCHI